jgi:hypothetical protein
VRPSLESSRQTTPGKDRATPELWTAKIVLCGAGTPAREMLSSFDRTGECARPHTSLAHLSFLKLLALYALIDHHGQVASDLIHDRCETLRRGINQEQQLRHQFFL